MSSRRILVVDDERIVAQDISECLISMGCDVIGTALSGDEAIEIAANLRPDLIMMDIVIQGEMDGIDAAKIIRESYDIPCVFLTAYSDPKVLTRAKECEPAGYIVKPFEEAALRSTVEIALYKVDMEHALKESHEWLATTLNSIGDGDATFIDLRCLLYPRNDKRLGDRAGHARIRCCSVSQQKRRTTRH